MNDEMKRKLYEAPAAERRGIYEYTNASGTYHGLCLVIAGNHRAYDKYVSVISLSPCEADSGNHGDELGLRLPDGSEWWCHCGMVTYMRRDRMGDMVYKISKQTMSRITKGIQQELGLSAKTEKFPSADPDYEKMYKDLIKTIASWNQPEKKHATRKDEHNG